MYLAKEMFDSSESSSGFVPQYVLSKQLKEMIYEIGSRRKCFFFGLVKFFD